MKRLRPPLALLLLATLTGTTLWRLKLHFVPSGAKMTAFLLASTDQQISVSPGGRKLYYRFNDAGAAHSGFHYAWCYTDHWLTGKKVVAGGFSEPQVRSGEVALPLVWHENGTGFSVRFAAGRHDPSILWVSGRLP